VLYVNGKIDESEQFRLLTFREISGRRMKELGSAYGSCSILSYRTPAMGYQPRLGHDRPYGVVGLVR